MSCIDPFGLVLLLIPHLPGSSLARSKHHVGVVIEKNCIGVLESLRPQVRMLMTIVRAEPESGSLANGAGECH